MLHPAEPSNAPIDVPTDQVTNQLLAVLHPLDYDRLLPHLKLIALPFGEVLHQPGQTIQHIYFPTAGVVSLALTCQEGIDVEVGVIGAEGVVGAASVMADGTALSRATVQVRGSAWQMPAEVLQEEFQRGGTLQKLLLGYLQVLLLQSFQTAVCNRLHTLEERLSRWLLLVHDRVQQDSFEITEEFLADMLGTVRPVVPEVVNVLRRANVIDYSGHHLTILDRQGLEGSACECYAVVRQHSSTP